MLAFKRSFKIKALELNRKILESAEDLKKPAVKEPTVPEGFELEIEKRLQERQATKKPQEDDEKPQNFKAKPLPKKVLEGVVVSLNTDEFQSCFFIAERQILLCGNTVLRILSSTGTARKESCKSDCSRVSCLCPQEESSTRSQGRGGKDVCLCYGSVHHLLQLYP